MPRHKPNKTQIDTLKEKQTNDFSASFFFKIPAKVGLALIRFYQVFISANTPRCCRFAPTCSAYTAESIRKYGLIKGCWMGAMRIGKCHPFHPGGYDPVP